MIKDITESGFESGVTLNSATITLADMGERTITADVKIAGGASIGDNSQLTFRGETFVPVVKDPQALKNNERVAHVVSVTFQSYVISELKRYWFFNSATVGSDVVVDAYTYQIGLPLQDFVTLFNQVLSYYYGTDIVMDASAIDMSEHPDAVYVEIDYTTVWDVLLQIYEKYGVRWKIVYANGVYTITLSNTATTLSHVFSYGYDGGLTSIERQVNDEIHNKIFGRGVDTNVPPYYFHRIPTGDTSGYQSDPDALYELKDIYFDTLRDATFRWYVRGWMQNPNHDTTWEDDQQHPYVYPTYDPSTDIPSTPTTLHDDCLAAYNAGLTDSTFNPIEYVKDDASILRYGEIWGNAEPNEDIYPSVKTAIIDYYNDQSDEVKDVTEKESRIDTLDDAIRNTLVWTAQYGTIQDLSVTSQQQGSKYVYTGVINPALNEASNGFCTKSFNVETGLSCYPTFALAADFGYLDQENGYNWVDQTTQAEADGYTLSVDSDNSYYYAKNPDTGAYLLDSQTNLPKRSPLSIPEGTWQLEFHIKATQVTKPLDSSSRLHPFWRFRIRVYNIKLTIGPAGTSPYRIFNVWLPNLWNTTKGQTETADEYVTRVWNPILGTMQEAAVYFVSGDLARSTDYDFKIVAPLLRGVEYDTSKTHNGVQSEWKLTLEKSEAEYQADGKFIPRTGIAPAAGDKLAFKGGTIVYPQTIIETAENDINGYKHKVLDESKDVQPSWNIQLDKVRINTLATGEATTIYSQLDAGKKITISSDTLIPDGDHTRSMFIESMTITWSDGTVGKPDVEIVLAKEVRVYHSAIETLQANIREVEVNSINEGEAEQVASRTAARDSIPSTGSAARAAAPLELANVLQSPDFKTGLVEGEGWAIYRDTFGNCVIEADKLNVRKGISAPTLEIDEWKHQGGVQILSTANMRIDSITDTGTTLRCFFDTKSGSITNLFHEHDIVLCTRTDETTGDTKAYRYEVAAIGETFVELSKTNHTGDTAAVGDEIIQFGNTTDANRQHVIILDAASGHERMLFGLNSITATGDVYYYAGAIQVDGTERRRWFVGDTSNSSENFIEYAWNATSQSYVLTIGGDVYVGGGGVSIDTLNYLAASLHDNGSNGLILSNQIAVYSGTGQQAQIQGGINGNASASQIAAWFGGAMTTEGQTAAKVVFKFDGSGYVAAKHISWDASGNCTIDGTVQLASGGTVGGLLTLVQGALQKSAVTSKGSTTRPIYFDSSAAAQEITGLNVPGDVQTTAGNVQALAGGVSANGIADLSESGGGGFGTVTAVEFNPSESYQETPYQFTPINGLISLPAYKTWSQLLPSGGIPSADLSSAVQTSLGKADTSVQPSDLIPITAALGNQASQIYDLVMGKQDNILDLDTIRDGAMAGLTAYQLPSGGIPKTDLATAVQASLTKADYAIPALEKGAANGVASLDAYGLVPTSQLPSYVDDVIDLLDIADTAPLTCVTGDKYYNTSTKKIYTATGTDTWGTAGTTPEGGKIYVNLTDSNTYRWSGTTMVEISKSLALGITHETAYYGDLGKIAYDHSQISSGNPHGVQVVVDSYAIKTTSGTAITVPFATIANRLVDSSYNNLAVGSSVRPVYFSGGIPVVVDLTTNCPSESGYTLAFIDTIQQAAGGKITATKKNVQEAAADKAGIVTTGVQTFGGAKTFNSTVTVQSHITSNQGNIQALGGGVSANGIADLSQMISGGSGTVTAIKFVSSQNYQEDTNYEPTDGVIALPSYKWSNIQSKPSSISGYGITDAYTKSEVDSTFETKTNAETAINTLSNVIGGIYASLGSMAYRESDEFATAYDFLQHEGNQNNPHNVTKAQIGLGNVENTAISYWSGTTNITTLGTITTGVWNGTAITNSYLVNSKVTINATEVSLGGSITTDKWGYSRNITISDSDGANTGAAVSVDGSGAATLKLPSTIKASLDGNASTATAFSSARSILLTGVVGGTSSSDGSLGWTINTFIGDGDVTNAMLANSTITLNGALTSLGGSFNTASITEGTAGTSSATSGVSFSIPYVTMNQYGIVTAYGTHTHSISAPEIVNALGTTSVNRATADASGNTITSTYETIANVNTGINALASAIGDIKSSLGSIAYRESEEFASYYDFNMVRNYFDINGNANNANLVGGLSVHTGRNNEANKVVRTDSSGYIQAGWINTTSGEFSGTPDRIYASNDGYIRYMTPSNLYENTKQTLSDTLKIQSITSAIGEHEAQIRDLNTKVESDSVRIWNIEDFFVHGGQLYGEIRVNALMIYQNDFYLKNGKALFLFDSGGNLRNAITMNSINEFAIGYGVGGAGYKTILYGSPVKFYVTTSRTEMATIDATGIHSNGGVAAGGIADLSMN